MALKLHIMSWILSKLTGWPVRTDMDFFFVLFFFLQGRVYGDSFGTRGMFLMRFGFFDVRVM